MNVRKTPLIAAALAAVLCTTPALAHGWPLPGAGAGTQNFTGAAGAGGGGGTDVPVAGSGGAFQPAGGGTSSTPPPPAPSSLPTPRPQATGPSSAGRLGSSAPTKGKGGAMPWLSRIRVPWAPAFLPSIAVDGYAARTGTVADGLRLSPSDGGWSRDQRPVMVFSYDATNVEHRRLLATLDTDGRLRVASHFFNCFRVDVGAAAEKSQANDARLSVFTPDGTLVGEITGQRKLSAVYDLMESAWQRQGGSDLTNKVAKMDGFLKTRAYAEHFIPLCEAGIVCPDCGHERLDSIERAAELRARIDACDRGIDQLRIVAKN